MAWLFPVTLALLAMPVFAQAGAEAPHRVLFLGDSLTYYNEGIWVHLEKLAAATDPAIRIETGKSTFGGAYLHRLWDRREPLEAIRSKRYDVVILQEDLPETTVADFREYAAKFVKEIREQGARPVLLMAWDYPRLGWITMDEIAAAHYALSRELSVDVIPVGFAWRRSAKARPDVQLYAPDREHPSVAGTYLAACVVYAALFRRDPSGLSYAPAGMEPERAKFLQRMAWETVNR